MCKYCGVDSSKCGGEVSYRNLNQVDNIKICFYAYYLEKISGVFIAEGAKKIPRDNLTMAY